MPINNLNAGTPQVKPTTVATTNTNTDNKADKPKISKDTAVKVAVGASLAALAAAGIYIATRGKGGEKQLEESANALKDAVTETITNDVKFVKGKAITASGENYSGKLTKELKDGSTITREYKDGVLQSATKTKDGNVLSSKSYSYNENGQLTKISDEKGSAILRRTIGKDRIATQTGSSRIITLLDENGNKTYTSVSKQNKNGGFNTDIIGFYPDGKHKRFVSKGDKSDIAFESGTNRDVTFYDKDGKVTDTLTYKIGSHGNLTFKYKNIKTEDISPYKEVAGRRYSIKDSFGFDSIELKRYTVKYNKHEKQRLTECILSNEDADFRLSAAPNEIGWNYKNLTDEEKQKLLDTVKDFKKLILENLKTGRRLANECSKGENILRDRWFQ